MEEQYYYGDLIQDEEESKENIITCWDWDCAEDTSLECFNYGFTPETWNEYLNSFDVKALSTTEIN